MENKESNLQEFNSNGLSDRESYNNDKIPDRLYNSPTQNGAKVVIVLLTASLIGVLFLIALVVISGVHIQRKTAERKKQQNTEITHIQEDEELKENPVLDDDILNKERLSDTELESLAEELGVSVSELTEEVSIADEEWETLVDNIIKEKESASNNIITGMAVTQDLTSSKEAVLENYGRMWEDDEEMQKINLAALLPLLKYIPDDYLNADDKFAPISYYGGAEKRYNQKGFQDKYLGVYSITTGQAYDLSEVEKIGLTIYADRKAHEEPSEDLLWTADIDRLTANVFRYMDVTYAYATTESPSDYYTYDDEIEVSDVTVHFNINNTGILPSTVDVSIWDCVKGPDGYGWGPIFEGVARDVGSRNPRDDVPYEYQDSYFDNFGAWEFFDDKEACKGQEGVEITDSYIYKDYDDTMHSIEYFEDGVTVKISCDKALYNKTDLIKLCQRIIRT